MENERARKSLIKAKLEERNEKRNEIKAKIAAEQDARKQELIVEEAADLAKRVVAAKKADREKDAVEE